MKKAIVNLLLLGCLLGFTADVLAAPLQIFVSIPPQKWLVDQLGRDLVSTHVLVDKGQTPHSFEPTARLITTLSRSRLYFTMGLAFEQQICKKINQSKAGLQLVDSTESIERFAMNDHDHKKNDPARTGRNGQQAGLDPHVWLAPKNLQIMASTMATAMAEADPENESTYEQNLQAVSRLLDQLDKEIQQTLAPYKGATFYVFHPAFGYFARAYGLHQKAVEIEGKSPAPKQLRALVNKAKADKVKVVFAQPQFDRKSAMAVARAIGGEVVPLDSLAEDVAVNLKTMAEVIRLALSNGNNNRK